MLSESAAAVEVALPAELVLEAVFEAEPFPRANELIEKLDDEADEETAELEDEDDETEVLDDGTTTEDEVDVVGATQVDEVEVVGWRGQRRDQLINYS